MNRRLLISSLITLVFVISLSLAWQLVLASSALAADGLVNPIGGTNSSPAGVSDPRIIIGNVIKALLSVTGSLALAVFIFGGFTWVTSAGSQEKIKKGKDMILWAALGLFIIFASYAMVNFVIGAVTGGGEATPPGSETPS